MGNVANVDVDRIKMRARSMGIKMEYLNAAISKYRGFLSCVRNGTDRIDDEELQTIAAKLNTTVEYLTGQTDDPEPPKAASDEQPLTAEQAALIDLIRSLPDEEVRRIADIAAYVTAKREQK